MKWYLYRKVEFFPFDVFIVNNGYTHGKNNAFGWRFRNIFFYYVNGYVYSFRSVKDLEGITAVLKRKFSREFVTKVGKAIRSSSDQFLKVTRKVFKDKKTLTRFFDDFVVSYEKMISIFQTPEIAYYFLKNFDKKLLLEFGLSRDYAARRLAQAEKIYRKQLKKIIHSPKALLMLPWEVKNCLETGKFPNDLKWRETAVIITLNGRVKVLWNKEADNFFRREYKKQAVLPTELAGVVVFGGLARGRVHVALNEEDFKKTPRNAVLVCSMTRYTVVPYLNRVRAIVTDQGGIACHAAIMAREFKVPTITGTSNATDVFKTGDLVEVDANKGIVRKLKVKGKK